MFRFVRYVLTRPHEAATAFWKAFTGTEDPNERITDEEARLESLRLAVGFYHHAFGRLPSKLADLSFNNHNDPSWDSPFIHWRGRNTFEDLYGFPYQYSVTEGTFELLSPGLETAKKYRGTNTSTNHS